MVPYLRAANVRDGTLDLADVKKMNFSLSEQTIFSLRPGDVLVTEGSGSLSAVGASAVWSGEIDGPVCYQNTLLRLRPRPGTDAGFLAWWCRHAFADGIFASIATGANIFHLSADRLRALPLRYVSLGKQRAIARFLDAQTRRIDLLIEKKRRYRKLLVERWEVEKFAVITGEKGGARKWSDEWYGSTPAHWSVRQLRSITPFINGFPFKPEDWDTGGIPIIRIENLNGSEKFNACSRPVDSRYLVRSGDLLFGWSGNRGTSFGPFRWEKSGAYLLNQHIFRLPAPEVSVDWLYWVLSAATPYIEELAHGMIGMVHITKDKLGRVPVPVPPRAEQARLAMVLDHAGRRHRAVVDQLDRQVGLLRERRAALITAAVTGELDIPGGKQ